VSTSTVSRVLNGRSASPETAERVLAAVQDLDYQVSVSARGLAKRYADIVGVIVADISNPPISRMFHGIVETLHRAGLAVMLGNSESDPWNELELIEMFAAQRARGVIYTGPALPDSLCRALNGFPGPVVVAAQQHPDLQHPTLLFDNYGASRDLVSYMVSRGHREIAFISGPLSDPQAGAARRRGYIDELESSGIAVASSYVEEAGFSIDEGYAAMTRIMDRSPDPPTAVYGASDLIAIGAMRCLHDCGVSVPDRVSVFGFDNIPMGAQSVPSLSSVELDFYELGELSATLLRRLIERKESQVSRVVFRHNIICRESFIPRKRH
jgi:LacI family transcriptional regulator